MSRDLAVTAETALAAGSRQRGFESGITQEDLIIPRAKLIQALSPEITEGLGVKPGAIINSLTKEVLPDEFIPVFMFKNFIRFNPRSKADPSFDPAYEPGAVIWKSTDPEDPKVVAETRFGPNGEKPIATTFLNFFSYFPGVPMPVIVSFSKTSYRAGKQLLSLAKFCGGDMFSRKYRLTSLMETNDIGTYAVFKVVPLGSTIPEDYILCERLWNDFSEKSRDLQIHEETTDDTGDGTPF